MSLLRTAREAGWIGPLDEHFVGMLRRRAGVSDEAVLLACALASRAPSRGDVGVDLAVLHAELSECEEPVPVPPVDAWVGALAGEGSVVRAPGEERRTPLVLDGTALYLDRYWHYQQRVVAAIRARVGSLAADLDEAVLQDGLDRLFEADSPSPEQREAAEAALRGRLTVIAGGPGTGKTAVVVKLLALLNQQARTAGRRLPRVVLVAPTGKAAARLTESIRSTVEAWIPSDLRDGIEDDASTIHRALGWVWNTPRFKHHAENPLAADVVVVDEASMVDLPLMAKLLDAVPEHARLVMLGDPDQLVSVEMGAVLGDIVKAAPALRGSVVKLRHTYRYAAGSGIQALAEAINAGDGARAVAVLDDPAFPDVVRLEAGESADGLDELLRPLVLGGYREAVSERDPAVALRALRRFRLLCAHRQGRRGVGRINDDVERWLREAGLVTVDQPWYLGRPLLVTRNDRQIGLYNGDVGVVLEGDDGERRVWFEGGESGIRSFVPVLIPEHDTVYTTTVHKAQGSEYDHVAVVLPGEAGALLTRELLYTAVTRAKDRVTVVGSREVVAEGVGRRVERMSGMEDLFRLPRSRG